MSNVIITNFKTDNCIKTCSKKENIIQIIEYKIKVPVIFLPKIIQWYYLRNCFCIYTTLFTHLQIFSYLSVFYKWFLFLFQFPLCIKPNKIYFLILYKMSSCFINMQLWYFQTFVIPLWLLYSVCSSWLAAEKMS